MCSRNGEQFISAQLESICRQDLLPAEIVVSDDASTDHCADVAEAFFSAVTECHSIDVQIIRNAQPLGITKNFEQAVSACSGDLIALCDQDDVWATDKLRVMKAEFDKRPELLLLHTNARLVDSAGAEMPDTLFEALEVRPFELGWLRQGRALEVFLRRNLVTGATAVFRRSLLIYAMPFPGEWLHDEWLAAIAAAVHGVDVLDEPLIDYRQHASNQIGVRRLGFAEKVRMAFAQRDPTLRARVRKFEVLLDRLNTLSENISPKVIELVRAKVAHQRFRAELPTPRWRRFGPVLREALTGRYGRFGRATHCIVRDLLESA